MERLYTFDWELWNGTVVERLEVATLTFHFQTVKTTPSQINSEIHCHSSDCISDACTREGDTTQFRLGVSIDKQWISCHQGWWHWTRSTSQLQGHWVAIMKRMRTMISVSLIPSAFLIPNVQLSIHHTPIFFF